jgi:rubrerythrin
MSDISCSSTSDIVNFAIEKEQKAMDFYQNCADRAKNPGLKKFFEELVQEEKRHRDMLSGLEVEGIGDVQLETVEDLRISDYLVDVKFRDDLTYQEALTLAMKKEEKAHAFYESWKVKCMHEKTAKLFDLLANEELKHKRNIEAIYDDEILAWD